MFINDRQVALVRLSAVSASIFPGLVLAIELIASIVVAHNVIIWTESCKEGGGGESFSIFRNMEDKTKNLVITKIYVMYFRTILHITGTSRQWYKALGC